MSLTFPLTTKIIIDNSSSDAPCVAYCPELDISSCGPTEEKAKQMLNETIEIVLTEAAKDGTLNKYLEEVGYTIKEKTITPPVVSYTPYFFPMPRYLQNNYQWAV